ncbi:MAG: tyrosine-type recombinase/integrase [Cyclobacteriaceae bacterium]
MRESNYQKTFENYLKSKGFTKKSIANRLKTINLYRQWIEQENLEIEQITYNDLLLFMKYSQKVGRTQKTINHYLIVVRHFYDHLMETGKTATNPATGIEVKGVKRKVLYHILEAHELNQLYNQFSDESLKGIRDKVMLGLLVYQGLQTSELARLEVKDIKLREGKIDVAGSVNSNGRILKLESHQVMDMYDYVLQTRPKIIAESKQETDKLLISESGGTQISNFMSRMMKKLKKVNPSIQNANQIRASVITKWLKTKNLRETQYLAGHRYISSTESYLQNEMEGLKEEVQLYHPLG